MGRGGINHMLATHFFYYVGGYEDRAQHLEDQVKADFIWAMLQLRSRKEFLDVAQNGEQKEWVRYLATYLG